MDFDGMEVFNDEVTNCNDLIKRYEFESCPLLSRATRDYFIQWDVNVFLNNLHSNPNRLTSIYKA